MIRPGDRSVRNVYLAGQPARRVYAGTGAGSQVVWEAGPLPVVQITGTSGTVSREQFRQACIDYGTTYQTVTRLPFQLDTSGATNLYQMFMQCYALTSAPEMDTSNVTDTRHTFLQCQNLANVPDMDTSRVTNAFSMFQNCFTLTDGNVRLIGKHPSVSTGNMIVGSGLTRLPFYDAAGNPID